VGRVLPPVNLDERYGHAIWGISSVVSGLSTQVRRSPTRVTLKRPVVAGAIVGAAPLLAAAVLLASLAWKRGVDASRLSSAPTRYRVPLGDSGSALRDDFAVVHPYCCMRRHLGLT
jgi:hypothetical protein